MKKIKEWVTFYTVLAVAFLAFSVFGLCVGDYVFCILCIAVSAMCVAIECMGMRIKILQEYAGKANRNEMDAIKYANRASKTVKLENARANLYAAKLLLEHTKVEFCEKRIETSEFLARLKKYEELVDECRGIYDGLLEEDRKYKNE